MHVRWKTEADDAWLRRFLEALGSALLAALVRDLCERGIRTLRVTTTNDNLAALRFYQKRGFRLRALRPGAIDDARAMKPSIPSYGADGIPIRDELDLELVLEPR